MSNTFIAESNQGYRAIGWLFLAAAMILLLPGGALGNGLLIPSEPELSALAMLNHHVNVSIEDQVAITRVDQTFRNHTDRQLEATYIFPIPHGASVNEFAMWVNGKKVTGELVSAADAKSMYTKVVRQTRNPALLDHLGSDMLRLKIFPIQANADQKISVRFTSVAKKEHDLVEYIYPLKSDRASASTLEEFRLKVDLKSAKTIGNIYSPTHDVTVTQKDDRSATVEFEKSGASLDRDFQIFYTEMGQDIGLNALGYRPVSSEDGYMMFLVSPRAELKSDQKVPRDIVFVMDTSGSMRTDDKLKQAKQALAHCLDGLAEDDRFALISFASTVNRYRDQMVSASGDHIENGKKWIDDQAASGGTAIHSAIMSALSLRGKNEDRLFTIAFFTDGQPTIGETNTDSILQEIKKNNSASTRIFSFGLGNDLNAAFLDQLAEQTRAVSSYVRPKQAIESKVASFFKKIHHPVLANLQLSTTGNVRLAEVYPPQLPDLFHGDQLVVLARYSGNGNEKIVLDGKVGSRKLKFEYDLEFADRIDDKPFVEEIWARRKVGYLLDQIRINGEQTELVDEVVLLAKRYGITTPYTSYLIMPDASMDIVARGNRGGGSGFGGGGLGGGGGRLNRPNALAPAKPGEGQQEVEAFARRAQRELGQLAQTRNKYQDAEFDSFDADQASARDKAKSIGSQASSALKKIAKAKLEKKTWDRAYGNYKSGRLNDNRVQKLGVDLSSCTNELKCQSRLQATAIKNVVNRNCMEVGGVWIDEKFTAKTKTITVKAQSDAYFRILERHPQMKEVFQLGNHVVWISPSGIGLVVDTTDGDEKLADVEIDKLFKIKKSS